MKLNSIKKRKKEKKTFHARQYLSSKYSQVENNNFIFYLEKDRC